MVMRLRPQARERVRRQVESFMTSPVQIKRGDLGVLDPATGLVGGLQNARTIYEGNARIKTITGEGTIATGDAEFDTRQVMISIPWDAPEPHRDDLVILGDDATADPALPGTAFRVMEVQGGSLFGDARRLQCTGWQPSRIWGQQ